jgi:hypothetical protein
MVKSQAASAGSGCFASSSGTSLRRGREAIHLHRGHAVERCGGVAVISWRIRRMR